jgi:cytochrome c peroxidase
MQFFNSTEAVRATKSFLYFAFAGVCLAQVDPGPRPGAAGAGGPISTLVGQEITVFNDAKEVFKEVDSVKGALAGESGKGLGPTFNGNSCAQCHAQPATGGSSPATNPQVALATLDGATNIVPSFITTHGPVREARFVLNPDGSPDGGVHGVYTIAGRSDAPGCTLGQPDFASQLAARNVIFRIPTPTFGLGLVENTPDATLKANLDSTSAQRAALGIHGRLNTSGNDGTVTRFGWKAQNKSLLIFAGEAYNVEQGVANEVFMNERSAVPGCVFNATPEDRTDTADATGSASAMSGDAVNFALFMRLSAPPQPVTPLTPSQLNGQALFHSVGCDLCHSPSLTAAASPYTGMSNVTYHPYSDFAVHHMGATLADGINQGAAGPDEFRTAPLWGVGQRLFFLHDGRTSDLLGAIHAHASSPFDCVISASSQIFEFEPNLKVFAPTSASTFCGSEADRVIANFNALSGGSTGQKQDILNFLRSL